jgi:hypothetical protein
MKNINNGEGLAQALDAGVHWVRTSAFRWDKIEPVRTEPPTYHWDEVAEQQLRNAADNGLEVIGIIHFTPDWAQKVPGSYCGPIKDEHLDEFAQFLQELVARYSVAPYNVRYWELGNEPDVDPSQVSSNQGYGCWGDESDPYYGGRYYATMLKKAYPAIKAMDPSARVLIGGLLLDRPFGGLDTSPYFLEGILLGGGGPYFDVMSFHAYTFYDGSLGRMGHAEWLNSPTVMPAKVAFLRNVLTQYGYGDKALMNTEAALLCVDPTVDCLETQAVYIPRVYAEALALGLDAQVYFAMINEPWRHTGLLLPDLTPKPAYYAYQTAAGFLSAVYYEGPASGYPPGIEGYTFHQYGQIAYVDVIWSADGTAKSVTVPTGATAYDHYGGIIAGSGTIQVDYSPVYMQRHP